MKRLFTYIFILSVALTAGVSCSREAIGESDQDSGFTLCFQTAEMSTRVSVSNGTPVNGVGAENVIDHVDYFFFADENPTSAAIVSGRLSSSDLTKVSDTEYKSPKFNTQVNAYKVLEGPSYLYVLVNYPGEVTATKMEDLLALPISTDFSKAQTSFVMDSFDSTTESGLIYLSPKSAAEDRVEVVKVSRIAAKLVLNMKVKQSYTDPINKDTWTPVLNQMWVNFLYGRKTATVAATPMAFDSKNNYFNTAQAMPNGGTLNNGFYEYTTDPVYTYPQTYQTSDVTAPYFKIFIPWISDLKGQNNFYYKIILPELGSFQRNKIYQLNVEVSVIGSTEDEWALFSDYVYVADWYSPDAIATSVESARYLDVPVKYYEIYGVNSITVPVVSSNDIELVPNSVTGTQQMVTETLGTEATHNIRDYVFAADGSEAFSFTYNLNGTIDLTTNYTAQNPNRQFDCTPITWTLKIRHKATTDEPYLTKEVEVTIVQYPSIYAKLVEGGNSFVNGYYSLQTASVTPANSDETRYTASNTQSNSGAYYRYTRTTDPYSGSGTTAVNAANYGRLNTTVADKPSTMTLVTVTAFEANANSYTVRSDGDGNTAKEFEYIIGDPRVPSGFTSSSLYSYRWGSSTTAWSDGNASKIMIAGSQKNIIAPAFMISSDLGGRPGGTTGMTYEKALKRCATYQEGGYPAGRWRLPTEAEMYFTYSLQKMYVIGHLYNGGDGYYASSGNVFDWEQSYGGANGRRLTFQDADDPDEEHSIRCVYDIWYWGEEPDGELHQYSIMP